MRFFLRRTGTRQQWILIVYSLDAMSIACTPRLDLSSFTLPYFLGMVLAR